MGDNFKRITRSSLKRQNVEIENNKTVKRKKKTRKERLAEIKRWYDINYMANDYSKRLSTTIKPVYNDLLLSQTFVFDSTKQIIMGINKDDLSSNFVIRTPTNEIVLDYDDYDEMTDQKTIESLDSFLQKKFKIKMNATELENFNKIVYQTAPFMEFFSNIEDDVALYYLKFEELSDDGKSIEFFEPEKLSNDDYFNIDYRRLFHEIEIMCGHYLWCRQAIIKMLLKEE